MILRVLTALFFLLNSSLLVAQEFLYLSSGGALTVKKINEKTGKLINFQRIEDKGMSVFTFSRNKKLLYIV
jgi:hypothetical protein